MSTHNQARLTINDPIVQDFLAKIRDVAAEVIKQHGSGIVSVTEPLKATEWFFPSEASRIKLGKKYNAWNLGLHRFEAATTVVPTILKSIMSGLRLSPSLTQLWGLTDLWKIIFIASLLVIYAIFDLLLFKRRTDATRRASKARKWMNTGELEEYAVYFVWRQEVYLRKTQRGWFSGSQGTETAGDYNMKSSKSFEVYSNSS
jgi:hypothetical protein